MGKALGEIGLGRAVRFALGQCQSSLLRRSLCPPQVRSGLLRFFGAQIGAGTLVHNATFMNLYRTGFPGLATGRECFIGEECLLDLADRIVLGDQVTLAARVQLLTHTNVGYRDHPLQERLPAMTAPVHIGSGSFVGAGAMLLAGVRLGREVIVGAGAVVIADVPDGASVVGAPARPL